MEDHPKVKKKNTLRPKNKKKSYQAIFKKITKISNSFSTIFQNNKKPYLLKSLNKTINSCQKSGLLSSETKKMIKNILNIEDIRVENVMTPRTDVIAIQHNSSLEDIKKLIIENEHTRIPIFKRNLDSIIGFIHSKDLAKFIGCEDASQAENFKINDVIRKILYVPHSMRIIDLLLKMRSSRVHIAIVLDEYGGTDGLVSIEDIVEEIVGEIEDEHDIPDDNVYLRIKNMNESIIQVGGRVEIEKISEFLTSNLVIEDIGSDFDTVGGLMFAIFKKVPEIGEVHDNSGLRFKILAADARSVKLVEISKMEDN
ncbi:MAG: CBS domain containing-hemolysin-like protein [Rickettsiales bacterium]|jgi:CBS domain containing-hemolysin-like protein